MKLSLALFLLVALIVILLPDDSEADPLRRNALRRRPGRFGGQRRFRMARRGKAFGKAARRGRTGDVDAPPPPPEGADDAAAGGEDGEGGEDVPDWCNPTKEM